MKDEVAEIYLSRKGHTSLIRLIAMIGALQPMHGCAPWNGMPASLVGQREWPTDVDDHQWVNVLGRSPQGVFSIVDPQVGKDEGQLRVIPFLRILGVTKFIYPKEWHDFDLVPHQWVGHRLPPSVIEPAPICLIITQEIEDISRDDLAYGLLRMHRFSDAVNPLIFVFDTGSFSRSLDAPLRPFVDEYDLPAPFDFPHLARQMITSIPSARNQPPVSLNLVWHGLTSWRRDQSPARSIADVFEESNYISENPYSSMIQALAMRTHDNDAFDIARAMRPWIDGYPAPAVAHIMAAVDKVTINEPRRELEESA